MTHRKPTNAAVYGIDLGKNVFHIAGADADGAIIGNWKLRRDTLLQFFRVAAPALSGMGLAEYAAVCQLFRELTGSGRIHHLSRHSEMTRIKEGARQ